MPDFAAIGAILTGIKTATEITKNLRDIDVSLEKAELKLKLAELMEALADVRMEAIGVQDELEGKDKRIRELEEAFQKKGEVVRFQDGMYLINKDRKPINGAHCIRCWDLDHKLYQLQALAKNQFVTACPICRSEFSLRRTPYISPSSYDVDKG